MKVPWTWCTSAKRIRQRKKRKECIVMDPFCNIIKCAIMQRTFGHGSGVSMAWHLPWAPFQRGCKNCLEKIKIFIYVFLNLSFAPHTFSNCTAASIQRPASYPIGSCIKFGRVAPAPPSIMAKLWDSDITQRSDIVTEQERSHAIST